MTELTPQRSPQKGRPKLSAEQRLAKFFKFRLSVPTLINLEARARAAGLSEADWLRAQIDDTPTPAPAASTVNPELLFELNNVATQLRKIGVNVNQIALDINRGTDFREYWRDTAAQLERDLAQARHVLSQALEAMDE